MKMGVSTCSALCEMASNLPLAARITLNQKRNFIVSHASLLQ